MVRYHHLNGGTQDYRSLSTDEGEITNETFIRATRGADSNSISATNKVNLFDAESKDNRNEFNSNAEFVPDKTGWYKISGIAVFVGNTTETDELNVSLINTNSNSVVKKEIQSPVDGSVVGFSLPPEKLTAGESYKIVGNNIDSSFVISQSETVGVIRRCVIQ